ncbi:MAG: phage major capsid protein [Alphaproteobacteria bacterium]|nr:phage major capsid protein [Alphaproteobacteria bacterium]
MGIEQIHAEFQAHHSQVLNIENRLSNVERTQRTAQAHQVAGAAASSGNFTAEDHQHADAFKNWLRSPQDNRATSRLLETEGQALSLSGIRNTSSGLSGPAGGYAIPAPVMQDIVQRITNMSPIRSIARVTPVTSTLTKFPLDRQGTGSGWIGETGTRTATAEPVFDLRTPTYGMAYALVQSTEELLADSAIDIGRWLVESSAIALAAAEGTAFVSGSGTNQPTGFLSGPTPVTTADATRASGTLQYVAGGAASAITAVDGLINLFYSLKAAHRAAGTWVMNSATASVVMLIKDTTGRLLWAPSMSENAPSTFLGRPVVIAEDMPAIAAGAFPVAFGDFSSGYLIADQGQIMIGIDNNITVPGLVKWYVRRRVGGVILNSEAVKLLKVAVS